MVLSMERWEGKVAVVTGASSGIGAAIAEKLVQNGLQVVGLARRKYRIEEMSQKLSSEKGKLFELKVDLTKEEEILEAFKWIKENLGPVHVLVNNAAVSKNTSLYGGDTASWKLALDVNVLALCIATREAVKSMRENDVNGHIIHINDIEGHHVSDVPGMNVYSATKFAVTGLTETLRLEFNALGVKIKVTSISPGIVNTEFGETNGYDYHTGPLKEVFAIFLQPEDIADSIVYVLSTPPHVQVGENTAENGYPGFRLPRPLQAI